MPGRRHRRTLAVIATVEAVSLAIMLLNLATIDMEALGSALGPVHGTAYLAGIAVALSSPWSNGERWLTCIPAVGAALAVRAARRRSVPSDEPGTG